MGVFMSASAIYGLSEHCPPGFKIPNIFYDDDNLDWSLIAPPCMKDESLFDKLYMYPVFASDKRIEQRLKKRHGLFKPVVMHG